MPDDKKRPEARDKLVGGKVPKEVRDAAHKKAKKEGRSLSAIIRSFLFVWTQDEYPSPPRLPDEKVRAKKRKKKAATKKKGGKK